LARKILLADDSVTAQNMGRKILADAGYEVIAVNNGSAALKKIAELKPDLVVLDVYMPGYSGLEVCQRLKESGETARIPVLLSVGKLEPFKPEEAQRVRADGFIVKPFEASELLSALSKLEDKVVPRAEPSKPGRFARAMAAVEESERAGIKEQPAENGGWKSRIGFPHKKTEPEPVADGASTYNPVNRDLRTVVETPAEKIHEAVSAQARETEASVDVAALAPGGLPKDVTPEEVAAITAAAAQIQMAGAGLKEESPAEASAHSSAQHSSRAADVDVTATPVQEASHQASQEDAQDVPVSMAVAAGSLGGATPRWTAVPVALDSEEAALSLEHEMQKAYAAFVPAETNSTSVEKAAESLSVSAADSAPHAAEPGAISPTEAVSQFAPASSAPNDSPASTESELPQPAAEAADFIPATAEVLSESAALPSFASAATAAGDPAISEVRESEVSPAEIAGEPAPVPALDAPQPPSPAALPHGEPAGETLLPEAVEPTVSASEVEDHQTAPAESAPMAETAGTGHLYSQIERKAEPAPETETKLDPEAVKSTAAAWASWRQIRDTDARSAAAQPAPQEFETPASAPDDSAAMAAAAGAEQSAPETLAPSAENPSDVASIVDSVLAGLRPKLMEEISRKMSEKK